LKTKRERKEMAHDDFYNFDPSWDDTKPSEEDVCPNCWETPFACRCDQDLYDYEADNGLLDENDYL
jgi:hypothetical protein